MLNYTLYWVHHPLYIAARAYRAAAAYGGSDKPLIAAAAIGGHALRWSRGVYLYHHQCSMLYFHNCIEAYQYSKQMVHYNRQSFLDYAYSKFISLYFVVWSE